MISTTFFVLLIPILSLLLLTVNIVFASHTYYLEKNSVFECGYHSFLGQNRSQFSISFFTYALLFLLFDLEILLVYPYVVSIYINEFYGLIVLVIFLLVLTLGFVYELGKEALTLDNAKVIKSTYLKNRDSSLSSYLFLKKSIVRKQSFKIIPLYFIHDKALVLSSNLTISISIFTLIILLFIFIPNDSLNMINILTLIPFNF